MITSFKVGDKFTVPEKFNIGGAEFEPDVVYTIVVASEDIDRYSIEPGFGWNNQWHISLIDDWGEFVYNIFEPYPVVDTSIGGRLENALQVLESAGPLPETVLDGSPEAFEAVAREYLHKAIYAQKVREAKEAEEKELEDLALKLMNTNRKIFGMPEMSSLSEVEPSILKDHWMGVAKEAKEFFSDK